MVQVPHNRLNYGVEETKIVSDIINSGNWVNQEFIKEAEKNFATRASRLGAVAVGTGSAALRLALRGLGVEAGDNVAVPRYSCVALANSVLACEANPIPIDICEKSLNIDHVDLEKKLSLYKGNIKAMIGVNTFGNPINIGQLRNLGIPIIEDCSHGFARCDMGKLGKISILSIYATKLIGGGEGGIILSDDEDIMQNIRDKIEYADKKPDKIRTNDKPNIYSLAIANCQLKRIDKTLKIRDKIARRYNEELRSYEQKGYINLPKLSENRIWYRYTIDLKNEANYIVEQMVARGIGCTRPIDAWCSNDGTEAEKAFDRILSIPIYPDLTEEMQTRTIRALKEVL